MSRLPLLPQFLSRLSRRLAPPRPAAPAPDDPPRSGGRALAAAALGGVAFLLVLAPAGVAAAEDVPTLTTVAEMVRASAERLPALLARGCYQLWMALAVLEIVAFAVDRWQAGDDVVKPGMARAMWLSFTLALVIAAPANPLTPGVILAGAEYVGELLTGFAGLDPSAVVDQGIEIFVQHLETAWDSGYFGFDFNVADFGGVLVTAFLHLFAYFVIALAVYLLFVQGAIALAFAPLAAAFGASRFTIGITESYAGYLMWWSFKLIALAMILAVGHDIAQLTQSAIAAAGEATFLRSGVTWQTALLSLAYAAAILVVPGQLAQKLTQSTPVSLRQILN